MIIDFHTHIFPEKIAERAIAKLVDVIHLTPSINGKADDLLRSMEDAGVNISIILPVVTDVHQFDSVLRYAAYVNETYADTSRGRLLSFAGIHPDDPDYKERLILIKREGFPGIKLHPNYQGTDFSNIRIKRILYTATELELTVLTHAGYDPSTPQREFCTPDMILDVLKDVAPKNLVLAHMGNNVFYDESEEKLCGQDVYLDTAYSLANMPEEQFIRMARKHGVDRILFATDTPWGNQKTFLEVMDRLSMTTEEKELILHRNAEKLLHLS